MTNFMEFMICHHQKMLLSHQDNTEFLDESSTQLHLVQEIYVQMSHQEHFFLGYMPAVFTFTKDLPSTPESAIAFPHNVEDKLNDDKNKRNISCLSLTY